MTRPTGARSFLIDAHDPVLHARLEGQIAIRLLLERFREIYLVPESRDLRWRQGLVLRGVEALPVIVSR